MATPTKKTGKTSKPAAPSKGAPVRRKADEERHETPFNMKVTAADRELFEAAAKVEDLPPTVWARRVLRKEARRVTGAGAE